VSAAGSTLGCGGHGIPVFAAGTATTTTTALAAAVGVVVVRLGGALYFFRHRL
jgi:hypothetical protein